MTLISVIVPVYKVEPYIRRCIDSVLAQTFTDFECILVDDGSPDNCPAICDEYAEWDKRFRVIHKEKNEGLPKARKSGLDAAISGFVFHLDSDDWIEPTALELLYRKQQETGADIVMGGFREIWPHGVRKFKCHKKDNETNALVYFLLNEDKYMFGKLYRKSLFNHYLIPDTSIMEDVMVNIQIFSTISQNELQTMDCIIYNYDNRTNGISKRIMGQYNYDSYIDNYQVKSLFWIENYLEDINCGQLEFSAFSFFFLTIGIIPYLRFNKKIDPNEIHSIYKKYYKKCVHKDKIKKIDKIMIVLFNISTCCGKTYVFLLNNLGKVKRLLQCTFIKNKQS
jgi:glycosyltransferase involved in cell wall biosynthesis